MKEYGDRREETKNTLSSADSGLDAALKGLRERGFYPPVVIDVGAAVGSWSQVAINYWPLSRYFCIEPLEERREALFSFARSSVANVEIINCGLADRDGVLSLGITDFLWDSSFAYQGSKARDVEVFSLDSLLDRGRILAPGFLKVDTQGFEVRIIQGGRKALQECAVVQLECSFYPFCPDMLTLDRMIGFMSEQGFMPYEILDPLRRPLDGAMGQCDIVFVRKDHWLVSRSSWC